MHKLLIAMLFASLMAPAMAQETQTVTIRFAGVVGDTPFSCGASYEGIGATASRITPSDFRFYVSGVELIDAGGRAVAVALDQDQMWQHRDVALLDFENRTGPCLTGTSETRDVVTGVVPKGDYRGLRFTLGVPFDLNHADATIASSPLNLTSMFWNWQAGYKFLRVDFASSGRPQSIQPGSIPRFGDRQGSLRMGFAIHVGSTMCAAPSGTERPASCANPNRVTVTFPAFDPARNVVVADLKALLAGVDVDVNQEGSPAGCMSTPGDGDCDPLMLNLGLQFGGRVPAGQQFFRLR